MYKILVTGGAGYIGSHTITHLLQQGFDVVSIDNFSKSFPDVFKGITAITGKEVRNYTIDLRDLEATRSVFLQEGPIQGIIHFAAFKSVGESVAQPLAYYDNNITSLLHILACAKEFDVHDFVFSSSCSVYGNIAQLPVREDTPLGHAECPYAATKQMGEQILRDVFKAHPGRMILLRYFNPVGAHPSALIGEHSADQPNNLVPVITRTAIGRQEKMFVWGTDYATRDGSCIRDYIHVMDIASAHTLALQACLQRNDTNWFDILNLGSGEGVSVLEAIKAFEQISGRSLNWKAGPRRGGDVEAVYSDNSRARSVLGWVPLYNLQDMMRTAWAWEQRLASRY